MQHGAWHRLGGVRVWEASLRMDRSRICFRTILTLNSQQGYNSHPLHLAKRDAENVFSIAVLYYIVLCLSLCSAFY